MNQVAAQVTLKFIFLELVVTLKLRNRIPLCGIRIIQFVTYSDNEKYTMFDYLHLGLSKSNQEIYKLRNNIKSLKMSYLSARSLFH